MISTTTTARTLIDNNSSVEWQRYGLALLALLLFSLAVEAQRPELFMPGKVSTKYKERDMTISRDGKHLLYSVHSIKEAYRAIVEMKKVGNTWTEPEIVSFSGQYKDLEPMFDPQGERLFFVSDRPLHPKDRTTDYNIWFVEKNKNGWGEPMALDTPINTEGDEFYPSLSEKGTLYFTATRKDGIGKEDIYYSEVENGAFQKPVSMDTAINTATYEFNAFIDPDEKYILFSSYGRPDGLGGGDLYISYRKNGQWTKSVNLGDEINSEKLDYCPFVSVDGKTLYFTSNKTLEKTISQLAELRRGMDSPRNGFDDIYAVPASAIIKN